MSDSFSSSLSNSNSKCFLMSNKLRWAAVQSSAYHSLGKQISCGLCGLGHSPTARSPVGSPFVIGYLNRLIKRSWYRKKQRVDIQKVSVIGLYSLVTQSMSTEVAKERHGDGQTNELKWEKNNNKNKYYLRYLWFFVNKILKTIYEQKYTVSCNTN